MPYLPLRIRPATALDASVLADFERSTRPDDHGDANRAIISAPTGDIPTMLADPGPAAHWIATLEGEVIGWLHVEALGPGHPRPLAVVDIRVSPAHRRRRAATNLLTYAIADAPAQAQIPEGHAEAAAFFESQNFVYDADHHLFIR